MRREPTEAQKQAAKERRERIRQLVKQVAEMTDAQRQALAQAHPMQNPAGHAFSGKNTALICLQGGHQSTILAGFQQWKKAGRVVRKGEHGFSIYIPLGPKTASENGDESTIDVQAFGTATVFDISQTEELKTPAQAMEEAEHSEERHYQAA